LEEEEVEDNSDKVLLLGWKEDADEEGFTPVISRRNKKKLKSACKVKLRGAQSKVNAASVKVNNNHPLCDVITGTRERRKNPKFL
jgi:hypothetical protein